jgi:hypothetical protein
MDDIERAAVAAEKYDPDDPAVVGALARVRAVLADLGRRGFGTPSWLLDTPSNSSRNPDRHGLDEDG